MTERGPQRHINAQERAAFLEERAAMLGVSVAKLIPPADAWKPKPRRKKGTVSVLELAQMDTDESHMPPPDLSTLLTEEEKTQSNKQLSPEELRKRRQFKSGIVSVLELAQMDTDGSHMPPPDLRTLEPDVPQILL